MRAPRTTRCAAGERALSERFTRADDYVRLKEESRAHHPNLVDLYELVANG